MQYTTFFSFAKMTGEIDLPTQVFDVNARVLCYHGPLIYEAKILKKEDFVEKPSPFTGVPGLHYFVHYKGWKQT